MRMIRLGGHVLAPLFAMLALAACSALQLSEPYDPQIENGVNAYHKSFIVFAKGLQFAGRGDPEARYDSETSRAFYAASAAELSNTILRARAARPDGTCPAAQAAALGLDALVGTVTAAAGQQLPDVLVKSQDEINANARELTEGSCTVITLAVLMAVHDKFEGVHRAQGFVSGGFAFAQSRNIEAAAEIAITAEQSKKP